MLRVVLALLVLANALFFGWTRGWLGAMAPLPPHGQREPGRIGAQVEPERVVLLSRRGTGADRGTPGRAATACLEAGPFDDAELATTEAVLQAAGLAPSAWARESIAPAAAWVLYAGRFPEAGPRAARERELRRLELPFEVLDSPVDLAPGLVLSRHASRDAAELALAAIADKPIRGVRVLALPPPAPQHWLRARAADAELQSRLFALDRGFRPCATPP